MSQTTTPFQSLSEGALDAVYKHTSLRWTTEESNEVQIIAYLDLVLANNVDRNFCRKMGGFVDDRCSEAVPQVCNEAHPQSHSQTLFRTLSGTHI